MSLKEFDWKNFLLMKCERIVLGFCCLTTVLMIGLSLFMPGHGFFTGSGAVNAELLNNMIKKVQMALTNNKPGPDENPPTQEVKIDLAKEIISDRGKYQLIPLFSQRPHEEMRRRPPELLQPVEGTAQVILAQLERLIFDGDSKNIQVLLPEKEKDPPNAKTKAVARNLGSRGNATSILNAASANRSGSRRGGFNQPGTALGAPSSKSTKTELEAKFIPVDKLSDFPNAKLAKTVMPLPMAVIDCSFPYQKEIESFRNSLQLPDASAVLNERSVDGRLPAFRFLGVRAQRRRVNSEGKPLSPNWEELNLEASYKPLLVLCGLRLEPVDPYLKAISMPGLVMPLIAQFREGQYADIDVKIPTLEKTLEFLTTKPPEDVVKPSPFEIPEDFDIFDSSSAVATAGTAKPTQAGRRQTPAGETGGDRPRSAMAKAGNRMMPSEGGPRNASAPGAAGNAAHADKLIPEYCLVRLIDVNIVPGEIYQYRIQVRMANPNYKRDDVASPNYATPPELTPTGWFEIPEKVAIPPELLFYAVDQKVIDGPNEYKGPNAKLSPDGRQVAMQIHKWLKNIDEANGRRPVGEWVVAERILVYRGEYVSRKQKCEVAEWMTNREEFVLAAESTGQARRKETGITIDFSQQGNDALLVDFEGGDLHHQRVARRVDEKVEWAKVSDKAPMEVLMLSSEGKLLSRDQGIDTRDEIRKERLKTYRDRIEEVKEARDAKTPKGKQPGGLNNNVSPFGGNRRGGGGK